MANTAALLLVAVDFTAATGEKEFNEWYNKIHLPDVLKAPGVVKATRYVAAGGKGQPKYLAVYELESEKAMSALMSTPEMQHAVADYQTRWGKSTELKHFWSYKRITP